MIRPPTNRVLTSGSLFECTGTEALLRVAAYLRGVSAYAMAPQEDKFQRWIARKYAAMIVATCLRWKRLEEFGPLPLPLKRLVDGR